MGGGIPGGVWPLKRTNPNLGETLMTHYIHTNPGTEARRHVLSQQMYRLRKRYRLLTTNDLHINASRVLWDLRIKSQEYNQLGGQPVHKGNVL